MGITPLAFTGISSFSDDFQTILNRSVSIASLPAKVLQNEQQDVLNRKAAMADLRAVVSSLAGALSSLGIMRSGGALSASSSSYTVGASLGAGAAPGVYQISEITSLASQALATSTAGLATQDSTPVSSGDHKLQLVVGGAAYDVDLTAATDNLTGVRDAINALGAGVTATILDTHNEPGRYFLSLAADSKGAQAIELRTVAGDPGSNLLTQTSPGADAHFKVNGQAVTAKDNTVSDVIPGVLLELKDKTTDGQVITVSVSTNRAPIQAALQQFVNAYNAMTGKLDAQIGKSAGVLSGEPVIGQLSGLLREITSYNGTGSVRSLADLGISLSAKGEMSFDSTAIGQMSGADLSSALDFLGDGSSGLSALASRLTALSDPLTGSMRSMLESYDETDSRLSEQIAAIEERVSAMQASLMARLQAADSLLASLDSQKSMLTATIESLNTVTNGKKGA
jgi:flagellar hook-associated protein 2